MKAGKETVLVIDDSKITSKHVEQIIRDSYTVLHAYSGQEGIACAAKEQPSIILLDVIMEDMNGFDVCRHLKEDDLTKHIPVIFLTSSNSVESEEKGLEVGGVDFLTKPVSAPILIARLKTQLSLAAKNRELQQVLHKKTEELFESEHHLQRVLQNLRVTKITHGVYWVQIPEAGMYILCGCPADVVKHLMLKGYIAEEKIGDIHCETGPNAILLSDVLTQNGRFSNLAEFPVLQMLYRQGMILPGHPNNTGSKPMLIGSQEQVNAQLNYIYRGNYGLVSKEELLKAGASEEEAERMMYLKKKFAFGEIKPSEELLDTVVVHEGKTEIQNGVSIRRTGLNRYEFEYLGKTAEVDLTLDDGVMDDSPYTLGYHEIEREYFSVVHAGEGDGWDVHRQSMSSILIYQGEIYLIDASPNLIYTLKSFGIDISEVKGIFHTHAHDDHFAGLPVLMQSDHRIKYFATPLVRASVMKKLSALMGMQEESFNAFFDVYDLKFNEWNDFNGLEIKPLLSPHPVETNIFLFRVLDTSGYKSYAHFADIVSLELLEKMMEGAPCNEVSFKEYGKQVREAYLTEVNLKKIDIGGGLIHGVAADFHADSSEKIILSHTAKPLNSSEKVIGSQAVFGSVDTLIKNQTDGRLRLAFDYFSAYFPSLPTSQVRSVLNCEVVHYNAGSIIMKEGKTNGDVFLVLTGSVEYFASASRSELPHKLTVGSIIGMEYLFGEEQRHGTWRAESHVCAMLIPTLFIRVLMQKNNLYEPTEEMFRSVGMLKNTKIFGEEISYMVMHSIADSLQRKKVSKGEEIRFQSLKTLCTIKQGSVSLFSKEGKRLASLLEGDFFGEHTFLSAKKDSFYAVATEESELLTIDNFSLCDIPIVHWKMLEVYTKRMKSLEAYQE